VVGRVTLYGRGGGVDGDGDGDGGRVRDIDGMVWISVRRWVVGEGFIKFVLFNHICLNCVRIIYVIHKLRREEIKLMIYSFSS
jgi:hypothetical protein